MKKILPGFFLILLVCFSARAQTIIFSEDFEVSKTAMPAGWHQQLPVNAPGNFGWFFTNYPGGYLGYDYIPAHTYCAYMDDVDYNYTSPKLDMDTLYTPVIDLSPYTAVLISFDVWFCGMYDTVANNNIEQSNLIVSTDGGKTWSFLDTIHGNNTNYWRTLYFDVSAYAGQPNVMFAFTYTDGGYGTIGEALDNISVYVPLNYDVGVTHQNLNYLAQTGKPYILSGTLFNYGYLPINSMRLNYSVNGGPVISDHLSSLSIASLSNYSFTHSIPWTPSVTGNNVLKIWADSLNGPNVDQKHANDTLTTTFVVVDSIQPKEPLLEEFTQASCNPCLLWTPQLDSIFNSVKAFCNPIRYHVNWPGRDMMNDVTQPVVGQRVFFYQVGGVPTLLLDGTIYFNNTYAGILQEANLGSPFKITVTNATYNPVTNNYSVSANIKSYGVMPAGLTAQVALTVDTMKYQQDQSQAEPPSYFQPPIGTGPQYDWFFPYTLNYCQVVENMMPDGNGTSLGSFTIGQTQTINLSWTKNHAWGDSNHFWSYDSVGSHITIFIQNNATQYVYQSAIAVPTVALGINELSDISYVDVYPNPSNGVAGIALGLNQEEHVSIDVYNVLGGKIYSENKGSMSAGQHLIPFDHKDLAPGMYFIRVITDNSTVDKKLIIVK